MAAVNTESIRAKLYIQNEYGIVYQDPDARLTPEETDWVAGQYGIRKDLHPTCISCQARQFLKYRDAKEKDGTPITKFVVPCSGIPQGLGKGAASMRDRLVTEKGLDPARATKILLSSVDPVAWAELMFNFNDETPEFRLRNYQKEQLRCSSRRMVTREGRRAGKTFIMALKLLYMALTMQVPAGFDENGKKMFAGPEIMIVTPYQSQILNIFDEMEKMLKRNRDLMRRITSNGGGSLYVKTPFFHMDFDNGALIKGFVSGVGTKTDGSGGGTMRGQNACVVYLDEMDMIPEETLEKVVMPILLTDQLGEVYLLATSTPIGKKGKFYTWCLEDPTFKEDYLPSTVLPQWDKVKKMLEAEGMNDTFRAEYLAEFISGGHGVFKQELVAVAREDYRYNDMYGNHDWWRNHGILDPSKVVFCIGIDWNKNAGTEFCVVAYDLTTHHYWVVERVNIASSTFSAEEWKKTVIRLNQKWDPAYIYADEGYGHMIIEDLKFTAHQLRGRANNPLEHSIVKLIDRLKAYNFSSKIDLRNPIDGTEMHKPSKEFLVETAVRQFESECVHFSLYDDQLKKELENYVVLRRNVSTGKPIYGPQSDTVGDHGLDSFMLAIVGIELEFGVYVTGNALGVSQPKHITDQVLKARAASNEKPRSAIASLIKQLEVAGGVSKSWSAILPRRDGETVDQAMTRMELKPQDIRVQPRGRGKMNGGETVYEAIMGRIVDSRGYSTDQEHLYENEKISAPHMINPRAKRLLGGRRR